MYEHFIYVLSDQRCFSIQVISLLAKSTLRNLILAISPFSINFYDACRDPIEERRIEYGGLMSFCLFYCLSSHVTDYWHHQNWRQINEIAENDVSPD